MPSDQATVVYKLLTGAQWRAALATGAWEGSADDARDGFIHLSTGEQLAGTAAKYFSNVPDLLLVAFPADRLGKDLRWEPSRGGALFPHLYAPLMPSLALWSRALALGQDGTPNLPAELP